jgi:hypothetical protein
MSKAPAPLLLLETPSGFVVLTWDQATTSTVDKAAGTDPVGDFKGLIGDIHSGRSYPQLWWTPLG